MAKKISIKEIEKTEIQNKKKTDRKVEIWAADCETDPFDGETLVQPFIWGLYNGADYLYFDTTEEFIDFIRNLDNAIIYAHNGGRFDWLFLKEYLNIYEPIMVIAGRLSKAYIGGTELRDSYNIFNMPLSAYQKDEIDYMLMHKKNRDKPKNREKIEKYLESDCVYLWDLINNFVDNYGLHLTQASAAMAMWNKISGLPSPKTDKTHYLRFCDYYHGGRVECKYVGIYRGKCKLIDINSAYPFAMKNLHPYGSNVTITKKLPDNDDELSRAFITLKCRSRGAFPFKTEKTKELIFPDDNEIRTFHVTGWEYIAARDLGKLGMHEIIVVKTLSDTIRFDKYVDHFYTLKVEAKRTNDKDLEIHVKIFLNALYGKYGAKPDEYRSFEIIHSSDIDSEIIDDTKKTHTLHCVYGDYAIISKPIEDDKQHWYNVATAASITGYVRAMMLKAINNVDGFMYCDTDSILCKDTGSLKLDSTELGAWDVEIESDYAALAMKKFYAIKNKNYTKEMKEYKKGKTNKKPKKWKTASKGVKFNEKEIIRVAKGETVIYNPIAPSMSILSNPTFIERIISIEKTTRKRKIAE
jgi:DNA polymerase elongation subunit (family B)